MMGWRKAVYAFENGGRFNRHGADEGSRQVRLIQFGSASNQVSYFEREIQSPGLPSVVHLRAAAGVPKQVETTTRKAGSCQNPVTVECHRALRAQTPIRVAKNCDI